MLVPNRHGNSASYRYGFNGMEKDDEIKGEGNNLDFGARMYDPRIGRWFAPDPLEMKYASFSGYAYALNNPIYFVDPDGKETKPSKILADLGIELPPLAAGFVDGLFEASPAGAVAFAWDMITDSEYRNTVIEGMKKLASDPIGVLSTAFVEDFKSLKAVVEGNATPEQEYNAGNVGGNTLGGVLTGAGAVKFFKKILKPDLPKGGVLKKTIKKLFTDNPFDEGGKLKKNVKYSQGEFGYLGETDDMGRVSSVTAKELQISKQNRLPHDSKTPGKAKGDHAGHLIGDLFGGSNKLDNLVSQASFINQSTFRKIEIQWQKAIDAGKKVSVEIKVNYADNKSLRPESFTIDYTIGDKVYPSIEIKNKKP